MSGTHHTADIRHWIRHGTTSAVACAHEEEVRRMMTELASDFASPGSTVYELGCRRGSMLPSLHERVSKTVKFVIVDGSEHALGHCRRLLEPATTQRDIEARCTDLDRPIAIRDASVVAMIGGLHAVRPLKRAALMAEIHRGLRNGGCLLLVEATLGLSSLLNNLFAGHRTARLRGASSVDGATDPLWGVAQASIPNAYGEERDFLVRAGFRSVELFFAWYGVSGFIAVK